MLPCPLTTDPLLPSLSLSPVRSLINGHRSIVADTRQPASPRQFGFALDPSISSLRGGCQQTGERSSRPQSAKDERQIQSDLDLPRFLQRCQECTILGTAREFCRMCSAALSAAARRAQPSPVSDSKCQPQDACQLSPLDVVRALDPSHSSP